MPSWTRIPHEHVENANMLPHISRLANMITIPRPNRDIDRGTSCRPISLLSVIAETLEKSLLPYKYTTHTHATRVQGTPLYSDGTTHSKQHRSKGVPPNGSPCANNHCITRYAKNFRHNKHTHTYQKADTDQDTRHNH